MPPHLSDFELNRQAVLGVLTANAPTSHVIYSLDSIAKRVKLKRRVVRAILEHDDRARKVSYAAVGSGISEPRWLWQAVA